MKLTFRPVTRDEARRAVLDWHSHHKPQIGEIFRMGATLGEKLVAVVVAGRPVAQALDDPRCWEVTRLAVGPDAPKYTASRLLGRVRRVATAAGVTRLVSYTRADEKGTCYKASGWAPVAQVVARGRAGQAKRTRGRTLFLPGLYQESSEPVDRVRWEVRLAG